VDKARPVNLNLMQIRFPIMAITSILHRISGVFMFLCLPYVLWALHTSLASAVGFGRIQQTFTAFWPKMLWILIITAAIYHVLAGLRHLVMDFGWMESLQSGRFSAWSVVLLSFLGLITIGICLW